MCPHPESSAVSAESKEHGGPQCGGASGNVKVISNCERLSCQLSSHSAPGPRAQSQKSDYHT